MFALIVAGGSGTRLWPASRAQNPKQLLKFIGNQTLLQNTFARLRKGFSSEQIFIATTKDYAKKIQKQLPSISASHYSIETEIKDRGPAIALATLIMHHHDSKSSFITAWSDHYIKDDLAYFKALKTAEQYLKTNPKTFITIGVKPTFAHTGFGYIEVGKGAAKAPVYQAKSFTEKPDTKTAEKFVKSKKYLWNTGYFISRTDTLLKLYQEHLPEVYKILMQIKPFLGTRQQQSAINKFYPLMPKVDIERGLIEKLSDVTVVPADFDWADVGSWKVIKDALSKPEENLTHGQVITHAADQGNLIYNYENKLVATAGLKDIIIINTPDALLVANKNNSEQIKELVTQLKKHKKLKKYL